MNEVGGWQHWHPIRQNISDNKLRLLEETVSGKDYGVKLWEERTAQTESAT